MKKQINPTIKAHLIRGAFYLLLLVAVCAIPFALAQRNRPSLTRATAGKAPPTKAEIAAAKQAVVQNALPFDVRPAPFLPRTSQHPLRSAGPLSAHVIAAP